MSLITAVWPCVSWNARTQCPARPGFRQASTSLSAPLSRKHRISSQRIGESMERPRAMTALLVAMPLRKQVVLPLIPP